MEQLVNGQFTFHTADIDGSNVNTVVIDKDDYEGKNYGYYSFYYEEENHDIEPDADTWDLVFMRYNRPGDYYGVAGVLANKDIQIAEARDMDPELVVKSTLDYTTDIDEIGYDWKAFGAEGFEVVDDLSYYVIGHSGDTTQLVFHSFSGSSGGGTSEFYQDGVLQSVSMGNAYVDRVFYSLENGIVHTSDRNGWDLAFDGTSFGASIRTNEEIGHKLWVYPSDDAGMWNENVSIIENNDQLAFVNIYPNPLAEDLKIDIASKKAQNISLHIYDMQGKAVQSNQFLLSEGILTIDMKLQLSKGVYQLVLLDRLGNRLHQSKLIRR